MFSLRRQNPLNCIDIDNEFGWWIGMDMPCDPSSLENSGNYCEAAKILANSATFQDPENPETIELELIVPEDPVDNEDYPSEIPCWCHEEVPPEVIRICPESLSDHDFAKFLKFWRRGPGRRRDLTDSCRNNNDYQNEFDEGCQCKNFRPYYMMDWSIRGVGYPLIKSCDDPERTNLVNLGTSMLNIAKVSRQNEKIQNCCIESATDLKKSISNGNFLEEKQSRFQRNQLQVKPNDQYSNFGKNPRIPLEQLLRKIERLQESQKIIHCEMVTLEEAFLQADWRLNVWLESANQFKNEIRELMQWDDILKLLQEKFMNTSENN